MLNTLVNKNKNSTVELAINTPEQMRSFNLNSCLYLFSKSALRLFTVAGTKMVPALGRNQAARGQKVFAYNSVSTETSNGDFFSVLCGYTTPVV